MSVISYNGIIYPYSFINSFRQEAVYDDMGQTDRCMTKIDVEWQSVINTKYIGQLALGIDGAGDVNLVGAPPAVIMRFIRNRMLEPRRPWSIKFNDKELLPGRAVTGSVDAKNGPQPQYCQLTDLTNNTFLMTCRIVGHYWENNEPGAGGVVTNKPGNDVLYNRWSEEVNIDNKNRTMYTRNGKFIIRSDNADGRIVDELRTQMAVLGVKPGFLRTQSKYKVSPDGLGVEYAVTDTEVFKKPPEPAFEATGRYTEKTGPGTGGVNYGECKVILKGAKTTPQAELLSIAVSVCSRKLSLRQNQLAKGNEGCPTEAKIDIDMYENIVECYMRCIYKVPDDRVKGLAAFSKTNTVTPFSDGLQYTPPYTARGTASLLLEAAAYFDPNLQALRLTPDNQLSEGKQPGQAGAAQEDSHSEP